MPEEKTTLTCHFERSEKSAEGKTEIKNITKPRRLWPKKKALRKFTGMALRNEIDVTEADRDN